MNKNKILIAKTTLGLLEKNNWEKINFKKILNPKKSQDIKNEKDLLININKYFDYLLLQELKYIEKSSPKDMLFEVLMMRLDILNKYRKSVKNIIKHLKSKPKNFLILLPTFLDSMILILSSAEIEVKGVKGTIKIKGILLLYFYTILIWYNDETSSLDKTMTNLDNSLSQIDNLINIK